MKFQLVFEKSGDSIPFVTVYNQDLLEHFVNHVDSVSKNKFSEYNLVPRAKKAIEDIKKNFEKTNEILPTLIDQEFKLPDSEDGYFDQDFLNRSHWHWVKTQKIDLNIDHMRFSKNKDLAEIGARLHDMYPDEIRDIKLAEAMKKLGYINFYEEVNMSVHRAERIFDELEFTADNRYDDFQNPFVSSMTSNMGRTNFYFGYTYVGRQTYDKFINYDTDLKYDDHYNYEDLELTFHLSLNKPQTIPFTEEFISWCNGHNIKPVNRVPIGNIVGLEENLLKFRTILCRNLSANNHANIYLT